MHNRNWKWSCKKNGQKKWVKNVNRQPNCQRFFLRDETHCRIGFWSFWSVWFRYHKNLRAKFGKTVCIFEINWSLNAPKLKRGETFLKDWSKFLTYSLLSINVWMEFSADVLPTFVFVVTRWSLSGCVWAAIIRFIWSVELEFSIRLFLWRLSWMKMSRWLVGLLSYWSVARPTPTMG